MLPILVALSVSSLRQPLLAFSCRFYYPPGDKRISYHQVYVSDPHGRHRRQITFGASEKTDVRWVGRHKLAWVESESVARDDNLGYHLTERDDWPGLGRLVIYDLRAGHRKIVERGYFRALGQPREFDYCLRGEAFYLPSRGLNPSEGMLGRRWVSFKGGEVQRLHGVPRPLYGTITFPRPQWSNLPVDCPPKLDASRIRLVDRYGGSDEREWVKITHSGRTVTVPDDPDYVWQSKNASRWWFLVGSYSGSAGSDQWVFEIDWQSGKVKVIAQDILGIDFEPHSRYWAASSNEKATAKFGRIRIWQRELWVGDARTGKQWRAASGAVHCDSARVQPDESPRLTADGS